MQAAAAKEARKTILVVEDEGLIADDIRRRLERLGYSVPAIASSGEEALRLARSREFDLVLMDIRLKGEMDGVAAAQQLRREFRAPVVYLTAHADQDTVSRATVTEPFGYILKPIADGNLRSVVQIALYKHEMERRLRTSEAWLSTTLRSIGECILATDPDGNIAFLNAAAEHLTGWSAADAAGRPLMDILVLCDERSGERSRDPVFDLFPDETRVYNLVSRGGDCFPVEVQCFENRTEADALGAIIVVRDIRPRREAQALLMQSQRMEAIGAIAGGMAADFEGALDGLALQADDLYQRLSGEDRERAGGIRHALSRAAGITQQFSALNSPAPSDCEAVDVNEAIRHFRDSLALCLGEGILLEIDLHPCAGFIRADRNRFQQMLIHLARHARKAMPQGGRWRIESSVLDLDAAHLLARRYGDRWLVKLRFTGAPVGEDSLSLAMVHAIVSQGGGHISGSASGCEILWPCIGAGQGVSGLVGRYRPDNAIPTVLLIDEEDSVRRAMWGALEQEGYRVLAAKEAGDAGLVAAASRGRIDLLIAGPGGAPLVSQFRIPAHLRITGYRHEEPPDPGVLSKPFPMEEFRRRVRALAQGKG